jgi:hypothetical protein
MTEHDTMCLTHHLDFQWNTMGTNSQAYYLSRWTRMTRVGESIMVENRVGVLCLVLIQRDGASIHWTPGVSEHISARF